MRAYERLLNYVVVRTPSDEHSTTSPSSQCQFDLARILADEMTALVVLVYDRDDVMVTVIGNGIHVCDKSDRWFILISRCGRNLSIYIAEFIQTYVRNPGRTQELRWR